MRSRLKPKPKALFFDLSDAKPRGRRQSIRMRCLNALKPGESVTLDHAGYETPFAVWIAQARMRQSKDFRYERVLPTAELYKVWLPAVPTKGRNLALA